MEVRGENRRTPPAAHSRSWFVRAQGITLGPYSDRDVLTALEAEEILPSDRVFSAKDAGWTALEEHPYFASFGALVDRPRASDLTVLESPRKLRVKPVYSVPVPVSSAEEIPEISPEETVAAALIPAFDALSETPTIAAPIADSTEVADAAPVAGTPIPEPEPVSKTVTATVAEPDPVPEIISAIPARPELTSEPSVERTLDLAPTPEPAPEVIPEPEIQLHADELLAAARALEQALDAPTADAPAPEVEPVAPEPPAAELSYPSRHAFPPRPEIQPVFLADPVQPEPRKSGARVIRIELKVPESPLKAAIAAVLLIAIAFATVHFAPRFENKTRGQNDFRQSDPSSPTTSPSEAGDPIPPLKAPTRPQRE